MTEGDEPESDEHQPAIAEHPRRFTMKSLGAIVDANRLKTGTQREAGGDGPLARASKLHGSDVVDAPPEPSAEPVTDTAPGPGSEAPLTGGATDQVPPPARPRPVKPLRRDNLHATVAARRKEAERLEAERAEAERKELQERRAAEQREFERRRAEERREARQAERAALTRLTEASAQTSEPLGVPSPGDFDDLFDTPEPTSDADRSVAARLVDQETLDDIVTDDGVDRSDMGGSVTRTGLGGLVGVTRSFDGDLPVADAVARSAQPLARQILDEEIAPGGRLSDPRDVNGVVLGLANDLPAATAVSVVRVDEEIELVGHTIDPSVDPGSLASVFSGVFRAIQVTVGVFSDGPLGAVNDVVIEGEHLDLVLRTLGPHYYLMVLEDRHHPAADLTRTRERMGSLAPGLTATLAHVHGDS